MDGDLMKISKHDIVLLLSRQEQLMSIVAEQQKSIQRIEELMRLNIAQNLLDKTETIIVSSTRQQLLSRLMCLIMIVQQRKTTSV